MVADSTFRIHRLSLARGVEDSSSRWPGSFEWRGGEGSVTDRESGLVHMQARHYDAWSWNRSENESSTRSLIRLEGGRSCTANRP